MLDLIVEFFARDWILWTMQEKMKFTFNYTRVTNSAKTIVVGSLIIFSSFNHEFVVIYKNFHQVFPFNWLNFWLSLDNLKFYNHVSICCKTLDLRTRTKFILEVFLTSILKNYTRPESFIILLSRWYSRFPITRTLANSNQNRFQYQFQDWDTRINSVVRPVPCVCAQPWPGQWQPWTAVSPLLRLINIW